MPTFWLPIKQHERLQWLRNFAANLASYVGVATCACPGIDCDGVLPERAGGIDAQRVVLRDGKDPITARVL